MEEVPEKASPCTAESLLSALRAARLVSYKQQILSKIEEASRRNDDELLNSSSSSGALVDRELIGLSRK